ncbi:putative F-box protein [Zalerion maritima]|uniref:F-box protein n=1 Tax=Zalerion maritima TaxID=339359 RepID=A0AAD5RGU0_9PEZI|nr:putative F-box protein [Zalerion maritima]
MATTSSYHPLHSPPPPPPLSSLKQTPDCINTIGNYNHNDHTITMKRSTDSLKTPSPRPEAVGRSSFCSVREHDSDLAQTFTSTKVSSYSTAAQSQNNHHHDTVFDDSASTHSTVSSSSHVSGPFAGVGAGTAAAVGGDVNAAAPSTSELQYQPPLTHPHSKLHGYFYPADSFRGWKQISVRGKAASRSYGDLQVLNMSWKPSTATAKKTERSAPGKSPFESLPYELLRLIIDHLVIDIPTHGVTARNVDLMSLLLSSRTMHAATLNTLYNHVTVPHSRIFRKFLTHVEKNSSLGTIVRRLDFCHFNPATIFSTAKERAAAHNLTADTLLRCLDLTPYLQEFLAQEYLDDDLDSRVLKKLFFGLPRLQAVDFCGCSSRKFKEAFASILLERWPSNLSIQRLSLHKCMSLNHTVYETLLPRMVHLTMLDVAGTQITDEALHSIPVTAKLTHLNLAKCSRLSSRAVIDFIAHHPAVKSLVFLSLGMDARSSQLLDVDDLTELLPLLPATLKSLNLKGSKMDPTHIPLLRPLTKHLEELALGRCLNIKDMDRLFAPDEATEEEMDVDWIPHTLRFLDASDVLPSDMDFGHLFSNRCQMLKRSTPLEVIEVSDQILERLNKSSVVVERAGWTPKEFGSRSWVVRHASEVVGPRDDGRRSWKWGASFWGMRKVPVAVADVGGMYGNFMFGRKL